MKVFTCASVTILEPFSRLLVGVPLKARPSLDLCREALLKALTLQTHCQMNEGRCVYAVDVSIKELLSEINIRACDISHLADSDCTLGFVATCPFRLAQATRASDVLNEPRLMSLAQRRSR